MKHISTGVNMIERGTNDIFGLHILNVIPADQDIFLSVAKQWEKLFRLEKNVCIQNYWR